MKTIKGWANTNKDTGELMVFEVYAVNSKNGGGWSKPVIYSHRKLAEKELHDDEKLVACTITY